MVRTLIDQLKLLHAEVELRLFLMDYPAQLVRVRDLLPNEFQKVEVAASEEGVGLVELIGDEDDLLAVEFEFDVGHHQVKRVVAPFQDSVVLVYGDALFV